ncbi:MAG: hypothetical protein ABIR52_12890 [Casimicrobiaceae bacterium]
MHAHVNLPGWATLALYFVEVASAVMVVGLFLFVANVCSNVRAPAGVPQSESQRAAERAMAAGAAAR